jgi:putative ABC transport system substrate-binding protein
MGRSPVLATAVAFLLACAAVAQTPNKPARIGVLCPARCAGPGHDAFYDELRKLGWIEGGNLTVDRRPAEGHLERLPGLTSELLQLRPDLLVASGTPPAQVAKQATSEVPIVFSFVADPVGVGLVQSLAHPGGNVTGVTTVFPGEFFLKNFEVLRELLPRAQRIAVLTNPANASSRVGLEREVPIAAQQFGFKIDVIEVRALEEVPAAVSQAKALGSEAVVVTGDVVLNTPPERITGLVAEVGLPAIYQVQGIVQAGGLIVYAPDTLAVARRHAHYVDRVLRGASPAEIPVEQPTQYQLIINLKTARSLGLTVPSSLLLNADEVIE